MKKLSIKSNTSHSTVSKSITLDKMLYSMTGLLLLTTIISSIVLLSSSTYADTSTTSNVSVTVNSACTITTGGGSYSETIDPGNYKEITGNGINVSCNDSGGYALYAIGYSGDSYDTPNNNRMLGSNSTYIPTATSGSDSYWAMKVAGSSTTSNIPTIDNSYSSYQIIPATYTKISHYTSSTVGTTTNSVTTPTYIVNISSTQTAGTYTGKVKYTMVHPNTAIPQTKYYMQDFTEGMCEVLAHSSPITVYDKRDEQAYTIQRLADGKCWMLDNLRLGGSSPITLTPSDTHIASNFTLPASGTENFAMGVPSWITPAVNADSKNTTVTSYGAGSGKVGNYYNYCAASAGTYCYTEAEGTGNASYDICPAGWRMPTGSSSGEYQALYTAYSSDATSFRNALSTPLSGYFYNGSAGGQDMAGQFWSSTMYSGAGMYLLTVDSSGVGPAADFTLRFVGSSMRCLLGS